MFSETFVASFRRTEGRRFAPEEPPSSPMDTRRTTQGEFLFVFWSKVRLAETLPGSGSDLVFFPESTPPEASNRQL
jgi:hypothetical protein